MMRQRPASGHERVRVVVVVAHPDDDVLFMGGTIALLAEVADVFLVVITHGGSGKRALLGEDGRVLGSARPRDEAER